MLRNRFYYGVKPLVPSAIRMQLRRWLARRKRGKVQAEWPILAGSERVPEDWPGWPEGKKFAFVLTHDVESNSGLAKCRPLMRLEESLGFRSSFNLIPEGPYDVPGELREELISRGFEVGVHDLYHDGKLYKNRPEFSKRAQKINAHLKNWGASGFRSGFMFHNLDWLHELEIQYDASTFDTDPFEPQPDCVKSIFPFWRERAGMAGYVELPYTLPQDSTLFLLLGETSPEIWLRKIDWIAAHGGMALVNVHPDYVCFPDIEIESAGRTYPIAFYKEMLAHVRARYSNDVWTPTARELAQWFVDASGKSNQPRHQGFGVGAPKTTAMGKAMETPARFAGEPDERNSSISAGEVDDALRRPKVVGMVCYSDYDTDNRVMRYAEALAKRGDAVHVYCLRRNSRQPRTELANGVQVHRIQDRFHKSERMKVSYLIPTLLFCLRCAVLMPRRQYDVIHVHNMPDFLVFAAVGSKMMGGRIILDIHDIVPELYASKFNLDPKTNTVHFLKWIERWAARFADHIIISNHLWFDKFVLRTGCASKCSVFINNVNSDIFFARERRANDGKFIVLFPGGLQWHQGLDIAIRAFAKVAAEIPNAEFHIYGDGATKESLIDLTEELKLADKVLFFDPLPVRQIAEVMARADLGVVPKRADSFGNEAYSTKIMEFMSLGVPVIVSKTKIDQFYFTPDVVRFFESGNSEALAEGMLELIRNPVLRKEMSARAFDYASRHSWGSRKQNYLDLVDRVCGCEPHAGPFQRREEIPSHAV